MDPQLRWLRRLIVARAAERVTVEAVLVGLLSGIGAAALGWRAAEVVIGSLLVVPVFAGARIGVAITTNPINHRYLLRWTDPTPRLRPVAGPRAGGAVADELRAGGFRFMVSLQRGDGAGTGEEIESVPTLDIHRAEGGRLVLVRGDDGETTVLSRGDDGRTLVTSSSLVPPSERLLVTRAGQQRGMIATDIVSDHVERLLELRARGIESEVTEPDHVAAFLNAEWRAWQDLGPFVGPLVAVGPRRWSPLRLQVDVPDDLLLDRLVSGAAFSTTGSRRDVGRATA